jgi:hypothetical protein
MAPKNMVYSYADPRQSDDFEIDLSGELSIRAGDIIVRVGSSWKVQQVHLAEANEASGLPTLWVFLVKAAVN